MEQFLNIFQHKITAINRLSFKKDTSLNFPIKMIRKKDWLSTIYLLFLLMLPCACANKTTVETKKEAATTSHTSLQPTKQPFLKYTSGIRSILHDSKGNYWFGSHGEGVCLFDGKTYQYFTVADGLSHNQVRTIQEDQQGHIWFGTGYGISSYDGEKITNHTPENPFLVAAKPVPQKWTINEHDLWFNAGNEAGVYKYDGRKLNFLAFPIPNQPVSGNPYGVTGFSKGQPNKIWISTYSALFGYDGKSFDIIDNARLGFTEATGFLHIRSVLADSKGNVWIGNNGIGVLLNDGKSITNFSKENGLLGFFKPTKNTLALPETLEHVFAIGEDRHGNIWFGDRDTGAWKYDGNSMKHYSIDKGLATPHIWQIYEDQTGALLFAMGDGGVYQFNGESFDRRF